MSADEDNVECWRRPISPLLLCLLLTLCQVIVFWSVWWWAKSR